MVRGVSLSVHPGGRPKSRSPLGPRLTQGFALVIPGDLSSECASATRTMARSTAGGK